MLTKDLLRVSRAGGGYAPRFAGREHRPLAARVIGTFQGHVGERRGRLEDALETLEREWTGGQVAGGGSATGRGGAPDEYKLVRGFAALVERDATFETRAPVEPTRARRAAFEAAEAVGVVTDDERDAALERAADALGVDPDAVTASLYADLEERQVLATVDSRWDPDELVTQYNLSLAQTALFDATEVRIRSSDPRALISAIKRLRLLYEIRKTDAGRETIVTGPTRLFRATRRYGTRFARLLRTAATAREWRLEATIDDRGTERTLSLSHEGPVRVPDAEPVAAVTFDSGVEADFAGRVSSLDLDWSLVREPEPLETGTSVMIPDFAFDYDHADFRVYVEIMGFWTPEYVEKKLSQLETLEDVDMLVAVDESLAVGEQIESLDHRAVPYEGTVRVKDVVDVLREYERALVAEHAAELPDELRPDEDAIALTTLAERHGVGEDAVETASFPEHERVGRTLVRPVLLERIAADIGDGMSFAAAEERLEDAGIADASAVLSRLGYRVEWDGLSGGTLREA